MLHVPVDIVYRVFSYIHDVDDISSLKLACRQFCAIIQNRQFVVVILPHAERAEALAALCKHNPRLVSETTHLQLGDHFTETFEAEELWTFLFTEGLDLLRLMVQVHSVGLAALNPVLEGKMEVSHSLGVLGLAAQVERLSVSECKFSNITKLCALLDELRTVRELEVDSGITFKYYIDEADARFMATQSISSQDVGDAVLSLESVVFRNASPWRRVDITIMLCLVDTGRLDSIESLTVDCGSDYDVFGVDSYIMSIADTLKHLIIRNSKPLHQMDVWAVEHASYNPFPRVPHLQSLHLRGFMNGCADWILARIRNGVPEHRSVTRLHPSTTSLLNMTRKADWDARIPTEQTFIFE